MGDSDQADEHTKVTFGVSMGTDRDEFLRRACDSCGREFKTETDPADLQWALGAQCQRMGLDVGDRDGQSTRPDSLTCPFCKHEAAGSEMHTNETVEYLQRLVYRDYMLPQINQTFAGLEETFGRGTHGSGGGFLSMSLKFTHNRTPTPPRPVHGPEAPDMKIVTFLCCGKRIKVPESFFAIDVCVYCKTPVLLA